MTSPIDPNSHVRTVLCWRTLTDTQQFTTRWTRRQRLTSVEDGDDRVTWQRLTVTNYKWTSSGVWSTNDCPTFYSTTKVCAHQQPSSLTLYHDGHKPWRLRKSYMKNRLLPKWMTLTFLVNIATHSPLNISETVRDRCLVPKVKVHRQEMALAYRDQMVTWSMTSRDCKRSNSWPQYTLRAQYLKNNRRCYLAIIAK